MVGYKLSGMDKSTSAMIAGIALGITIVADSTMRDRSFDSRLEDLEQQCRQENVAIERAPGDDFELTCSRHELWNLKGGGVQGQIAKANHDQAWWRSVLPLGFVVPVVMGIPWAWYFLLRRIRELRDVLAGNHPS